MAGGPGQSLPAPARHVILGGTVFIANFTGRPTRSETIGNATFSSGSSASTNEERPTDLYRGSMVGPPPRAVDRAAKWDPPPRILAARGGPNKTFRPSISPHWKNGAFLPPVGSPENE